MKVIVALLIILVASTAFAITGRPPEPNDIPFEYDVNAVPAEILLWSIAEPNLTVSTTIAVHNKWGLHVDLIAYDHTDANTPVLVQRSQKQKDPDGGWNQYFNVLVTLSGEGVHYIELTCIDKVGRQDKRTLLILGAKDDTPYIFVESPPIISTREAQRAWQYAKKMKYPVTNPMSRR
jgi:hypothetical protein